MPFSVWLVWRRLTLTASSGKYDDPSESVNYRRKYTSEKTASYRKRGPTALGSCQDCLAVNRHMIWRTTLRIRPIWPNTRVFGQSRPGHCVGYFLARYRIITLLVGRSETLRHLRDFTLRETNYTDIVSRSNGSDSKSPPMKYFYTLPKVRSTQSSSFAYLQLSTTADGSESMDKTERQVQNKQMEMNLPLRGSRSDRRRTT